MLFTKFLVILSILVVVIFANAEEEASGIGGHYNVELQIQDKTFHDHLFLDSDRPISPFTFQGPVKGFMEVPGVFTAPLVGRGMCSAWSSSCYFEYSIVATENDQEFKVFYKMQSINMLADPVTFKGQAFLKDNQLLGNFTAVKKNE